MLCTWNFLCMLYKSFFFVISKNKTKQKHFNLIFLGFWKINLFFSSKHPCKSTLLWLWRHLNVIVTSNVGQLAFFCMCVNGKKRLITIPLYQNHKNRRLYRGNLRRGLVTTPFSRPVTKKKMNRCEPPFLRCHKQRWRCNFVMGAFVEYCSPKSTALEGSVAQWIEHQTLNTWMAARRGFEPDWCHKFVWASCALEQGTLL